MGRRKLKNPDELVKPGPSATIAERLRYLVDLTRKTQVEFGKLINVDPSNMSKILSGNYPITDAMVNRVVVNLGVSKDWLTNGTDVPYPKSATAGAPLVPEVDTGPVAVHDRNAVG
ncbi:MAG TPA: helix-turn-helix transcriptional regulator, partial [Muribaculaceae bacterium]|nr:helix-turn-helix transcriptional regulator [Muribaculaceae bacterium]